MAMLFHNYFSFCFTMIHCAMTFFFCTAFISRNQKMHVFHHKNSKYSVDSKHTVSFKVSTICQWYSKKCTRNGLCAMFRNVCNFKCNSISNNQRKKFPPTFRSISSNAHNNQIALDKSISLRWHCAFAMIIF